MIGGGGMNSNKSAEDIRVKDANDSPLKNVLEQKSLLDRLIRANEATFTKNDNTKASSAASRWIYHKDASKSIHSMAEDDTVTEEVTSLNLLDTFVQIYLSEKASDAQQEDRPVVQAISDKSRIHLISLRCPTVDVKQPLCMQEKCPSDARVKTLLSEESIILLVYGYDGYCFSSEYNLVYRGKFSSFRAIEDLRVVVQKAVRACDPAIANETCLEYANYVMKRALWECERYLSVLKQAFKQHFPALKGLNMKSAIPILVGKVFIGKTSGSSLEFTIRVEDEIILNDSTRKKNEGRFTDKFIYYNSFLVDKNSLDTFDQKLSKMDITVSGSTLNPQFSPHLITEMRNIRIYWQVGLESSATTNNQTSVSQSNESETTDPGNSILDQISLDASAPRPIVCSSSLCSELIGWGYDYFSCLGLGNQPTEKLKAENDSRDEVYEPRPVPISWNIAMEQVRMIACSTRHSILLTHLGSMYACGDNAEGALGLGDLLPRHTFTFIDWTSPATHDGQVLAMPKIVQVAVGGGVIGSHSMAVDKDRVLYAWGFAKATGLGSVQAALSPKQVKINFVPKMRRQENDNEDKTSGSVKDAVRSVACGAGFTLCLTTSGYVYSWGQWSHGRLGNPMLICSFVVPLTSSVFNA